MYLAEKTGQMIDKSMGLIREHTKYSLLFEALGLEFNPSRFLDIQELTPWLEQKYNFDDLIEEFWGIETRTRLIAVSKQVKDKSWKGLVTEWNSFGQSPGQFRFNKVLIENLLGGSLGPTPQRGDFKLKTITELEFALFEHFFIELENSWKDHWRVAEANANGTSTFLIWAVEFENSKLGAFAISVPPGIGPTQMLDKIKPEEIDLKLIPEDFKLELPIDLTVGKTKLKLGDIQHLSSEDILIFEDSHKQKLSWEKNELYELEVPVELPPPSAKWPDFYYEDFDEDVAECGLIKEEDMNNDILTDLPVELTAQFKSVSMPLHQLLEIQQGGVMPLGLLLDSELVLMAPGNKAIAAGELVVMGNQFGLKINNTNIQTVPKAKLNPENLDAPPPSVPAVAGAIDNFGDDEQFSQDGMDDLNNFGGDQQLEQELQDVGIEPGELDELEDLY